MFNLRVPANWVSRPSSQGLTIGPADAPDASLTIFSATDPNLSRRQMIEASTSYLSTLSSGRIKPAQTARIGGMPAFELVADEPSRKTKLTGVLDGPERYVLISQEPRPARTGANAQLDAAIRSIRSR